MSRCDEATPRLVWEPRRGLKREEAARYVGVSTSTFDKLVEDKLMPDPNTLRGCVRWDLRKLDAAWDALADGDGEDNEWD